jgi:ppGpp synthetase/RelA/SpoT-type nucleotidyltranferase
LAEEVKFALETELSTAGIKTHDVIARCKTLESLREKIDRKRYDQPLEQAEDLAGVRVVTLFLSDLPRVEELVRRHLDVLSEEDTIEADEPAVFGYMSKHYVGTLAARYAGPRYDDLEGLKVEIQLRTILMDAWASVSHHLAYKSDSSIPRELRRQFSALSGLFYVADLQFEALFAGSTLVQHQASAALEAGGSTAEVDLNLDTLAAWLRDRFPDRAHSDREQVARLVEQLKQVGYTTLGEIESLVQQAAPVFDHRERGRDQAYSDVGAVRVSVALVNPQFDALRLKKVLDDMKQRDEPRSGG